jgi:hypothetical protein
VSHWWGARYKNDGGWDGLLNCLSIINTFPSEAGMFAN